MEAAMQTIPAVRWRTWTAAVLKVLLVAFLLMDSLMKVFRSAPAVEGTVQLGYQVGVIVPLGVVLLALTVLYVIPRTSVLGAVLLTGYLGGAVATQVRVGAPPFSIIFPLVFAALIWGPIYLLDERVRALLPVRR